MRVTSSKALSLSCHLTSSATLQNTEHSKEESHPQAGIAQDQQYSFTQHLFLLDLSLAKKIIRNNSASKEDTISYQCDFARDDLRLVKCLVTPVLGPAPGKASPHESQDQSGAGPGWPAAEIHGVRNVKVKSQARRGDQFRISLTEPGGMRTSDANWRCCYKVTLHLAIPMELIMSR